MNKSANLAPDEKVFAQRIRLKSLSNKILPLDAIDTSSSASNSAIATKI